MQRTLSLGENATPDTAITKLNSLVTDNREYRRLLAQELEQATGKNIIGEVAKQQLKSLVPKGLAKYTTALGTAGFGGILLGASSILPILALASPRIMAEFFRIVGATNRTIRPILSDINNFRIAKGLQKIGIIGENNDFKLDLLMTKKK